MKLLSTNASYKPLYAALGLPEDATSEQVHAAFLNISRAHHPDVQGDAEIFAKARRAHEILMDPVKRRVYDETGLDADNDEKMVRALGLIRNIVAGIFNDGKIDIDIVARLRTQMNLEINGVQSQICALEVKTERIQKMTVSIEKRWKGSLQVKGALLAMLGNNLKAAQAERLPLDSALDVVNLAVKLMDNAKYERDEPMDIMGGQLGWVAMNQYPWTR